MARIDSLTNFLSDIASAIKEKTGKTNAITPANFDTEIASIETGGGSTVTKGIIINEFDEDGYATDVSVVGMTTIPSYYFYYYMYYNTMDKNKSLFNGVGKNLHLPEDLISIEKGAFAYCTNLALTSLPSGITSIGMYAFRECTNLALTSLPSGITSIENYAFQYCTNLALTSLPSGITSIGSSAFNSCTNLALTELPSGITSIGNEVFYNCTNLTEITCLGNITSIENYAFASCTNLSKFALPNITSVPTCGIDIIRNSKIYYGTGYIYVPDDLVESFKSATNWSTYADQIKAISEMEASS